MLKEVDWMMDELGRPDALSKTENMLGKHSKQILCLVGWGNENKTLETLAMPGSEKFSYYSYYGRPDKSSLPLPISSYLSHPINYFENHNRGIATLACYYTGKHFDYISQQTKN